MSVTEGRKEGKGEEKKEGRGKTWQGGREKAGRREALFRSSLAVF